MTKPTAPCLTADYYTYSTYTQRDDCYGGFEPNTNFLPNPNHAPSRLEYGANLAKKEHQSSQEQNFASAHFISFIYCSVAIIVIVMNAFLWTSGVNNTMLLYSTIIMSCVVLTCLLFHLGVSQRQPFFCIPFVVFRTLETFLSGVLLSVFTYAIINRQSNFFNFFLQCSKIASNLFLPHVNLNFVDATQQLCLIGWTTSALLFAISVHVCLMSFKCTISIADQFRNARRLTGLPSNRLLVNEFYPA